MKNKKIGIGTWMLCIGTLCLTGLIIRMGATWQTDQRSEPAAQIADRPLQPKHHAVSATNTVAETNRGETVTFTIAPRLATSPSVSENIK